MNKLAVYVVGAMALAAFGKFIWTGEPVSGVVSFALASLAMIGAAAWHDKDKAAVAKELVQLQRAVELAQAKADHVSDLGGKYAKLVRMYDDLESQLKKLHIASNIVKRGPQQ